MGLYVCGLFLIIIYDHIIPVSYLSGFDFLVMSNVISQHPLFLCFLTKNMGHQLNSNTSLSLTFAVRVWFTQAIAQMHEGGRLPCGCKTLSWSSSHSPGICLYSTSVCLLLAFGLEIGANGHHFFVLTEHLHQGGKTFLINGCNITIWWLEILSCGNLWHHSLSLLLFSQQVWHKVLDVNCSHLWSEGERAYVRKREEVTVPSNKASFRDATSFWTHLWLSGLLYAGLFCCLLILWLGLQCKFWGIG